MSVTVLFFSSKSCAYCPGVQRIVESICQQRGYAFRLQKLDDPNPDRRSVIMASAAAYTVSSLPTVVVVVNGQPQAMFVGSNAGEKLAQWVGNEH